MTGAFVSVTGRKWCHLNGSHGGYRGHQALMEAWKQLGVLAIRQARLAPVEPPVQITATVHRTTRAKADAHNVTPTVPAWWWVKGGEYGNYLCDDCAEALGYVFAGRLVEL